MGEGWGEGLARKEDISLFLSFSKLRTLTLALSQWERGIGMKNGK